MQRILRQALLGSACIIFVLSSASAAETLLHAFANHADGAYPLSGVIADVSGNLYGTTEGGGGKGVCQGGCGTVYKLAADGTESVFHAFDYGDGAVPNGNLIVDGAGNFYGTAAGGGANGYGVIFKLAWDGSESVLYSFAGVSDGTYPYGGLTFDGAGNLYGATIRGGTLKGPCGQSPYEDGCGTLFEVEPGGTKVTLYTFKGGSDGGYPNGGLVADSAGNFYGTTLFGGLISGACPIGCGVVFKMTPNGAETVLHTFQESDGGNPSSLIADGAGNLYGTNEVGGSGRAGNVFKISPLGAFSEVYGFRGGDDGANPRAGVIMDSAGNLYGTTYVGGHRKGTAFKISPDGTETQLTQFGKKKGELPLAPLFLGSNGELYGTTRDGAKSSGTQFGVLFSVPSN